MPKSHIVVVTIGETTWAIGETICLTPTDDCEPQHDGMKAHGLNSDNTGAKPSHLFKARLNMCQLE